MSQLKSRKLRWLLILLAVAGLAVAGRRPVLQGMARGLVVDQRPVDANYLWAREGSGCYDEAAAWYREDKSRRILLIDRDHDRLVQLGAMPSAVARGRRALELRGVPSQAVLVIPGGARNRREEAELLDHWLTEQPQARVLMLCGRFRSRSCRYVLDSVLSEEHCARVWVAGLPDRQSDETSWWTSRGGVRGLMFGYLGLFYTWCDGQGRAGDAEWDLNEYEQMLRQMVSRHR